MRMMEYTLKELEKWHSRIEKIVSAEGLDCYAQEFEICSYEDMICYEAYVGMPAHYPHWSYGKTYEKQKSLYRYNLTGLPYEMVINADPCIAFLMKDNTLLLQILTMSHVYGHNDFFKNNRLFRQGSNAKTVIDMFKNHANRIRRYIQDPSIGYLKVERILDAAHALKFQTQRVVAEKSISEEEKREVLLAQYYKKTQKESILDTDKDIDFPDIHKVPLVPTDDIISFIIEYGTLEEWEKDILHMVNEETQYFIPQMETKIMNEGWASYWHYEILNKLELGQDLHIEFLSRHNQVIKPFMGALNPYFLGFKMFKDIKKRYGRDKIFEVRRFERDHSFVLRYLTEELCGDLQLFQYGKKGSDYIVEQVADQEGWKEIRNHLLRGIGIAAIPVIEVEEMQQKDRTLLLKHVYEGRELELSYAYETLKHLSALWQGKIILQTVINNVAKLIICDENNSVSMNGV